MAQSREYWPVLDGVCSQGLTLRLGNSPPLMHHLTGKQVALLIGNSGSPLSALFHAIMKVFRSSLKKRRESLQE